MRRKSRLKPVIDSIYLVVFPLRNPSDAPGKIIAFIASQLADVLAASASKVFIVTGNFHPTVLNDTYGNINIVNVKAPIIKTQKETLISKALRFFLAQFTISIELIRLFSRPDSIFVFFGSASLILPILILRLRRKKIITITTGSVTQSWQAIMSFFYLGRIYSRIIKGIDLLGYAMSDRVVVYSKELSNESTVRRFSHKISIAPRHFLNLSKFNVQKQLNERDNIIGYIGRLGEGKGTLSFVKAIPLIMNDKKGVEFLIGGDGELKSEIEENIEQYNLGDQVILTGWIPHTELPKYLNKLKLLVLPSDTEGLPNIILEAMACGTPVLATPVGSIADIIVDGLTGFIMVNNSPDCIFNNVIKVLNHSNLQDISQNARAFVEKEFTYDKAVGRYKDVILKVLEGNKRGI